MTEVKKYKGVKENELPIYNSREMRYRYIYKVDEGSWVPEWARTYVRYERFWTMRLEVGFYIADEASRKLDLIRKAERLASYKGNYVFRYTPVPHTGGYKNWVSTIRGKGLMSEIHHNKICKDEIEPEYGNVVRKKRDKLVRCLRDWDGLESYHSQQRGWKRSKKRKQWMK
ncbi:hypothetical protein KVP40.0054 [Vibrio phage KVP40]|uniref:Uncharacterized protein n=3 Tax=Schizotequatrovirus KVP40 TaxID=1914019 RepID=Q6WI97_BPKVM|nr:hypothetical protein KVP40.0054 [Vibrio phage KVP40]AFN37285.1 hypothetical protein pp2_051 [Vibrio phage phi-pp2]QHJ74236.1 hypothetical protein VH12019_00317 [Vibrio phage VH1_2019]QIW90336.1 hypothetical protein OLCHANIL_00256 [Vibrio phage V05]UNA01950.1 hypothetical protein [Vibrio phage PC-Liy1]URQ03247.1 hypothetical protein PVA8_261 [Vibrio phage PVA8]WBM58982.1 hypothetical protein vBValMPVA8_260 [Vibrio phage vB_ValM_PVA8]WOL24964.1 hypothetical protein [Vibrio phage PG216]